MPFQIIHNDITRMHTDAIVNAANSRLTQGGGVCGAIFKAAGEELLQKECSSLGTCPVGHAVITKGYNLPAKYIIHTVGPIWDDGMKQEAKLLSMAYQSSLELAKEYHLESIAFPLISSGIYGYPKYEALQIAVSAISEFLLKNEMEVYLVVFDRQAVTLSGKLFTEVTHYIKTYYDDSENMAHNRELNYSLDEFSQVYDKEYLPDASCKAMQPSFLGVPEQPPKHTRKNKLISKTKRISKNIMDSQNQSVSEDKFNVEKLSGSRGLEEVLGNMEETFSEMLLRLIDEKGKTDIEVYKKANMDRKLFSKIRSNKEYQPKKGTALALAIALELSVDETKDLLLKAGYCLSASHKFDVIIRYFIECGNYDIYVINETLFYFDQPLLGV